MQAGQRSSWLDKSRRVTTKCGYFLAVFSKCITFFGGDIFYVFSSLQSLTLNLFRISTRKFKLQKFVIWRPSNSRLILLQGVPHSNFEMRWISKASTQILTWASIRLEAQWYIGVSFIWVRLRDRKQRSITIRLLYPQAASSRLIVSSLVFRTHLPSYRAASLILPRLSEQGLISVKDQWVKIHYPASAR